MNLLDHILYPKDFAAVFSFQYVVMVFCAWSDDDVLQYYTCIHAIWISILQQYRKNTIICLGFVFERLRCCRFVYF